MVGLQASSSKGERSLWIVEAVVLVILFDFGWATLLAAQADLGQLAENPFSVMQYAEMCDTTMGTGIDFLNPRVQKALAQCGNETGPAGEAACTVLEAVELLADNQTDVALKKLRSAFATYEGSGDLWGVWFVEFLMGIASHNVGDRQAADSYYQSSLGRLDQVASSQQSIPGRSLRLFGELLDIPEEYAAVFPLISELGMSSILVDMAAAFTHFFYGASLACQNRTIEAQQEFHEAELRFSNIVNQSSGPGLRPDGSFPSPASEQETIAPHQSLVSDVTPTPVVNAPYDDSVPVEEALDRNKRILFSSGSDPSTQARLWRERAVLLSRAGGIAEAQRAINTARSFAVMSEVPLLEAELLLNYGLDLYRLKRFEDAEECLKEGMELLSRREIHKDQP